MESAHIVIEAVAGDRVVLPVLDRHAGAVSLEVVGPYLGFVAVAAPHAVLAAPRAVCDDLVAAERDLDAVRGRVTDVVAVKQVVVRPARPRIHRRLARPEKDAVATMRHGVERDDAAR